MADRRCSHSPSPGRSRFPARLSRPPLRQQNRPQFHPKREMDSSSPSGSLSSLHSQNQLPSSKRAKFDKMYSTKLPLVTTNQDNAVHAPKESTPPTKKLPRTLAIFEQGPDGYKHYLPKVPTRLIDLPSWLTSSPRMPLFLRYFLTAVPPLPIISDPKLFLSIFENNDNPEQYKVLRKASNITLRYLQFYGDRKLCQLCNQIFYCHLGTDTTFAFHLSEKWQMNDNWRLLSAAYQLNRYLGWVPKSLGKSSSIGESRGERLWADIWEAWWGALCIERELWGEDLTDLATILHHLIHMCHRELFDQYSPNYRLDDTPDNVKRGKFLASDFKVRPIFATEPGISIYLPHHARDYLIGFLVPITPPPKTKSTDTTIRSVFATTEQKALLRARQVMNGIKCNCLFFSIIDCASDTAPAE
jgi:hypothetical protein